MVNSSESLSRYIRIFQKTPVSKVFRLLIELGMQIVNADEGSLLLYVEETDELEFAMSIGSDSSEMALKGQRVPMGEGITGLAALSQEVQTGAPVFKDIKQSEQRTKGPEAVIAAPMVSGGELIGVITAVSFEPNKRFSGREAKIYAGFASIAALIAEQQRAIEVLETDDRTAGGKGTGLEDSIIQSITRITETRPQKLKLVAEILSKIEKLLE